MISPEKLEELYKSFSNNLPETLPDGVIPVDLQLLKDLDLLKVSNFENSSLDSLSHYFHVIEAQDKVTLFNEQFAIWIVPKMISNRPTTLTFISLITNTSPHLELVFSTMGVYNNPKYILKILQHFLAEVVDTEETISAMDKKTST